MGRAIAIPAAKPSDPRWNCGHHRIPENTQRIGGGRVRCRICNREIARKSLNRHRADASTSLTTRVEATALRILESKPVTRLDLREMVAYAIDRGAPELCFSKIAWAVREGGLNA